MICSAFHLIDRLQSQWGLSSAVSRWPFVCPGGGEEGGGGIMAFPGPLPVERGAARLGPGDH